jgi:CheY-like chemotaxis protein
MRVMHAGHAGKAMAKRVLIADDHEIVRKMVCSMFVADGFDVSSAENGAQAVEKAQELQPDLVVLDLAMPIMNGLAAARILKVLMPSLPLLMFTNNPGSMVECEAREAGVTAVVSKSDAAGQLLVQAKALVS